MRAALGLLGLCLLGFAAGTYFDSVQTGLCVALACLGAGLLADALRK